MNHKNSCDKGLGPLTMEQCTEPFSKCKFLSLFPSLCVPTTTLGTSKGNGLLHLPFTGRAGTIMLLSTITGGALTNKPDFCPNEAFFLVLAAMKL